MILVDLEKQGMHTHYTLPDSLCAKGKDFDSDFFSKIDVVVLRVGVSRC